MGRDTVDAPARPLLLVAIFWSLAACSPAGPGRTPDISPLANVTAQSNGSTPGAMVSVSADHGSYRRGERILVTIANGLSVPLYAPRTGCSVVSLWRLEQDQWVNVDSCTTSNVYVVEVPAMSELVRPLGTASHAPAPTGPIVIGPTGPSASGGDLTKLPTVAPWRSGDPVRVMPEGAIAPPFSASGDDLGSGTYRIEFSYAQGDVSAPVQSVYSESFIVTD
jgi:hypothetical protein